MLKTASGETIEAKEGSTPETQDDPAASIPANYLSNKVIATLRENNGNGKVTREFQPTHRGQFRAVEDIDLEMIGGEGTVPEASGTPWELMYVKEVADRLLRKNPAIEGGREAITRQIQAVIQKKMAGNPP